MTVPEIKNINVDALVAQLNAEAMRAKELINRSAEDAVRSVLVAARALKEMPQGAAELLTQAKAVLVAEVPLERFSYMTDKDNDLYEIDFTIRSRGGAQGYSCVLGKATLPPGRYRAILAFLPLPAEEKKGE